MEDGLCAIQEESGEPVADCIYAKLVSNGYSGSVLSSVGGKACGSIMLLCDLFCGEGEIKNIADQKCVKLCNVIGAFEFVASVDLSTNANPEESKDAFTTIYVLVTFGGFGNHAVAGVGGRGVGGRGLPQPQHRSSGGRWRYMFGKGCCGSPWNKFLNFKEYGRKKSDTGWADNVLMVGDSDVSTAKAWGTICLDHSQMISAKLWLLSGNIKNREIIFFVGRGLR